jgi:protein subunit release factor A
MNEKDLRIDTFTNSSPLVRMRITHVPTGISVLGEGDSKSGLRRKLMKELTEKVATHERK